MRENHQSAFLPESWPFELDWLPPSTYLVGGAVRDALLCRNSEYLDLDFVVEKNAIALASKIAKHYGAGFVILDEIRGIARIVFKDTTVDFADQEGESVEEDLGRRDYTINAIAYNPRQQSLVDPFEGKKDLVQKQLRMIKSSNLQEDPLRLLRAYRQAAQLNFQIERETRSQISQLAPKLAKVAPERVQSELNYLLSSSRGNHWLAGAWLDGVLSFWLPEITPDKITNLTTIDLLSLQVSHSCKQINWQEKILPVAKLAVLVGNDPIVAEANLIKLKYPKEVFTGVKSVFQCLPELRQEFFAQSIRLQYYFFQRIGKNFPVLALVALCQNIDNQLMYMLLNRYSNPDDLVVYPRCLLTGKDLINSFDLKPSPIIGYLLEEIQIAQIEGKIKNQKEAIEFARDKLHANLVLKQLNRRIGEIPQELTEQIRNLSVEE